MKAIILSAGQGKRLLPLTATSPKCLLPIRGKTLLEWQVDELKHCGISRVTVVTGYRAEKVDDLLHRRYGPEQVKPLFNAAYAKTDNLVSCWAARDEMTGDFILLNGDTLFEAVVLQSLLKSPAHPITVAVSHKDAYDADDMKVTLEESRLVRIGKNIPSGEIHGESIGMIRFLDEGPAMFREAMEAALQKPEAVKQWYLSVIDAMAGKGQVWTHSIPPSAWCEVDYPIDLEEADRVVRACAGESASASALKAAKHKPLLQR
jgi:choline kinase